MTNDEIRFRSVRLIDSDGTMIGVVTIDEAKRKAEEQQLDLVLISAVADNPVCKVMDYGKYMFEQSKREREAKKNQKITEIKEVQLKISTEEHDFQFKTKNACRFLNDGDRVKVVIKFRGREMAYTSRGYDVMREFTSMCAEFGVVDKDPRLEGRNMVMYLAPKKQQ
ncbi:MAG: translation initiation factor IF-3 [Saccharofermentanales bacterium]